MEGKLVKTTPSTERYQRSLSKVRRHEKNEIKREKNLSFTGPRRTSVLSEEKKY